MFSSSFRFNGDIFRLWCSSDLYLWSTNLPSKFRELITSNACIKYHQYLSSSPFSFRVVASDNTEFVGTYLSVFFTKEKVCHLPATLGIT